MTILSGQHILVGITGGIAAYKTVELVRRLRNQQAQVQVVMTQAAESFITPLTLQAVSGRPVRSSLLDPKAESGMGHIEMARWADLVVVAPASADFLARLAAGAANDLLSTLCLATRAPILLAPAMNHAMWDKPATRRNAATLAADGMTLLGPASGEQACGETGPGRMLEPDEIVEHLQALVPSGALSGTRVLVTAGPTFESVDPVRGLTNHSSGKMGYAVAAAARAAGAQVDLVSGPVALSPPAGIAVHQVSTAEQMLTAVEARVGDSDIFIGVAAVVDYRPREQARQKIKKSAVTMTLDLVRNPDILATVAAGNNPPFTVGFAAETDDPVVNARVKLEQKNLDLIAVNPVGGENGPFGSDDNSLVLVARDGETDLGRDRKTTLARRLTEEIARRYHEKHPAKNS